MDAIQEAEFQRLTLEKLRFHAKVYMSSEMAHDLNIHIDRMSNIMADQLMVSILGYVMSNEIHQETQGVRVPETWWDHLKEGFFPNWLVKRMPVRYREITTITKFIHVCPHLTIDSREEERFHLQYMMPPGVANRVHLSN